MAEMVAEQHEKNDKEERPKEKVVEKDRERHEAAAPAGKRNCFKVVFIFLLFKETVKRSKIMVLRKLDKHSRQG